MTSYLLMNINDILSASCVSELVSATSRVSELHVHRNLPVVRCEIRNGESTDLRSSRNNTVYAFKSIF